LAQLGPLPRFLGSSGQVTWPSNDVHLSMSTALSVTVSGSNRLRTSSLEPCRDTQWTARSRVPAPR
jgi:hypothetical protein